MGFKLSTYTCLTARFNLSNTMVQNRDFFIDKYGRRRKRERAHGLCLLNAVLKGNFISVHKMQSTHGDLILQCANLLFQAADLDIFFSNCFRF